MELLFLGIGAGLERSGTTFHSNMVLTSTSGKKLLIDCGTDIRFSLLHSKIALEDINSIYISHLHSDHIGGLAWLGLLKKFSGEAKPELWIHEDMVSKLWHHGLKASMDTLFEEEASLDSFFKVMTINENDLWNFDGINLRLVQTEHMFSNKKLLPTFGLSFYENEDKYFLTTDTRVSWERFKSFYEESKLIFHDCETLEKPSSVHSHFSELCLLPAEIKAKMWLYHYNDSKTPDAKKEGFLGFVKQKQKFLL